MKTVWRYSLLSALLGMLVLAAAAVYLHWSSRQPVLSGSESFVIPSGTGVHQVAAKLVREQVLAEPYTFTLWAYVNDATRRLRAGEYAIDDGTTLAELLALFTSGRVIQRSVTLIEGWTFKQFRAALYRAEKLQIETRALSGAAIMRRLGREDMPPEGRFFPETYHYTADMTDLDLLRQAHAAMQAVLEAEWQARDPAVKLDSKDQALVLASIIEKETGAAGERRTIAAVFHNRLARGMRLQTDPTVIYGLGDEFDGDLTRAHLETDTPFNTYTRGGLPPTPIAMPGRAAIHAALNPGPNDALYFVARGDGSHVFSRTLEEHNRAVYKYQIKPNAGDGSSPDEGAEGDQ